MAKFRCAHTDALVFTGPEQAHLPDAELIEAAVAEARTSGAIGSDGGWATEEDFRAALHVDVWSDGQWSDEDEDDASGE